jgi:hypothetical protein
VIIKELDPFEADDRFGKAGRQAEEQMAHYLRRAFGEEPNVLVFNGIRLQVNDDAAQIDHLILHPYGLIIVESKSVTTRLTVNDRGEWIRWFNGSSRGMASPVRQAERQRDFLRSYLKRDGSPVATKELALNVRVAISDAGIIDRPKGTEPDELDCVYKADQIPEEIRETINTRKLASFMPKALVRLVGGQQGTVIGDTLTPAEMKQLRVFLLEHHTPYQRRQQPKVAEQTSSYVTEVAHTTGDATQQSSHVAQPAANSAALCGKCQSTRVSLEYKYNFYLRCADCKGATALVLRCMRCGTEHRDITKPQTFKDGGVWSTKCSHCGQSIPVDVT